jgi:hypothetical protein
MVVPTPTEIELTNSTLDDDMRDRVGFEFSCLHMPHACTSFFIGMLGGCNDRRIDINTGGPGECSGAWAG